MALAFGRRLGFGLQNRAVTYSGATFARYFATKEIPCPTMGDSITEGSVNQWKKAVGDYIAEGEVIAVIDTDKVSIDIISPVGGFIKNLHGGEGDTIAVGAPLYTVDEAAAPAGYSAGAAAAPAAEAPAAAAPKADAPKAAAPKADAPKAAAPAPGKAATPITYATHGRNEKREKMSRMRLRIAERLKDAQNNAAMLTTFNECDMSTIMALRSEVNDAFVSRHGVKFGFVSAFLKASAMSFQRMPNLNAYIDHATNEIVYKDYVDISVAVATPTGLLVPVIRDTEKKTIAELEQELGALAKRAREGKIALEEMSGGTFTISNGGVYGSMMGTPIINPPQASVLGMHGIVDRAVVRNKEIVVRPVMNLALTYDHKLYDGREGVLLLKSIRDYIEDPKKMLLDL